MSDQADLLLNLYATISAGVTDDRLTAFFHEDAQQVEYPSLMRPNGHRRALAEIQQGAEVGATMIRSQTFEVHNVIEQGQHAAVQLTWTAILAVDVGALAAGTRLVSHVAAFYDFRDGLVLRQSSYDCYEPMPRAGEG